MRAGLYARVSREEQAEGYSLAAQLDAMRRFCREKGWTVVEEYTEPGVSGTIPNRPELQRVLADCQAGKLDVLLTHKLDRLFRNLKQLLLVVDQLDTLGVSYVSTVENIDRSTPHGKLLFSQLGSVAQFFSDNLRTEIQKGKKEKVRQGLTNSRTAPYGYRRADNGLDVPDPEAVKGVLLAFEAYTTGEYSDAGIAELLNASGYKPSTGSKTGRWTISSARHLLMNRVYIGEVRHKKDWYPGQHQPIVGRELFDGAQEVRARRTTNPSGGPKGRIYLLHRVARCWHCGRFLHMSPSRKPNGELKPFYTEPGKTLMTDCPAAGRHVRQELVDAQVAELVGRLELPDDWRERLAELAHQPEKRENLEARRRYLKDKLKRLRDCYVEGDYTRAEYNRQKADLQGQLDSLREPEPPAVEQAGEVLESLGLEWANAPKKYKRDMLRCIFEGIYVDMLARRLVAVKPWPPFVPLFRMDGLEEGEEGVFYVRENEA
jgi:site-specific DNA recombinase